MIKYCDVIKDPSSDHLLVVQHKSDATNVIYVNYLANGKSAGSIGLLREINEYILIGHITDEDKWREEATGRNQRWTDLFIGFAIPETILPQLTEFDEFYTPAIVKIKQSPDDRIKILESQRDRLRGLLSRSNYWDPGNLADEKAYDDELNSIDLEINKESGNFNPQGHPSAEVISVVREAEAEHRKVIEEHFPVPGKSDLSIDKKYPHDTTFIISLMSKFKEQGFTPYEELSVQDQSSVDDYIEKSLPTSMKLSVAELYCITCASWWKRATLTFHNYGKADWISLGVAGLEMGTHVR